ncbi:MAG: AAA family ATPase [Gammaproteobacteria bacterium]|nr:AAA family ATPase [Gammaproteobacteria bacterium]
MRSIYLDNFRGFQNSYMELQTVNFLVGENSSGKTSLLWAVRLLFGREFWMNPAFSAKDGGLGNFHDIVSANSADPTYFKIGLAALGNNLTGQDKSAKTLQYFSAMIQFGSQEGLPAPTELRFQIDNTRCVLKIRPKTILIEGFENCPIPKGEHFDWGDAQPSHRHEHKSVIGAAPFLFSMMEAVGSFDKHLKESQKRQDATQKATSARPATSLFFTMLFNVTMSSAWVAPIRSKPKRTYDEHAFDYSAEGAHTPYLIQKFMRSRTLSRKFREYLKEIGTASGLFDGVRIERFGTGQTAPFELDVLLGSKKFSISNVGYGISQSLPIFVEMYTRENGTLFAIQQPEVHLHPRAQAAVGDQLFDMANEDQKSFIVETHSDYLIDRYRMRVREAKDAYPSAQIVFCERKEGFNYATSLAIDERGSLPQDQPEAYRTFFINEATRALELS